MIEKKIESTCNYESIALVTICFKQNESELDKNPIIFLNSIVCYICRAIFCSKPHQNWTYGSRNMVILVLLKTIKYKGGKSMLQFAVS